MNDEASSEDGETETETGLSKLARTTGPFAAERPLQALVRILAILATVVLAWFDLRTPDAEVPLIVYGTLIGLAIGIDSSWLGKIGR